MAADLTSAWDRMRSEMILKGARARYGAGWELMSEDQRQNYLDAAVLRFVMGQDAVEFAPAQRMVERLQAGLQAAMEPIEPKTVPRKGSKP